MSSRTTLFQQGWGPRIWKTAFVMLLTGWFSSSGRAETLASQRSKAEQLVSEALAQEIYGRGVERQRLLARAAELCPDQPAVHWHRGEVRVGNRWLSVLDTIETDRQRQLRDNYEKRRASAPDTVEGQLALADWCAGHGLAAQETAHLNRILQLAPDHPEAGRSWKTAAFGIGTSSCGRLRISGRPRSWTPSWIDGRGRILRLTPGSLRRD